MTESPDPILAPEAVDERLILLDARGEEAFLAGRAAWARRLPIEVWEKAAKSGEASLATAAYWEDAIGQLGIDGSAPVAVLDDGRMTEAARAWFILQHFGVPASVVDGGWPALEPILSRKGIVATGKAEAPRPARFAARPGAGRVALVERAALREALAGEAPPQVFDTRTAAEHVGDDLKKNPRGGRLPGAANVPHASLLAEGNRMRPPEQLREILGGAGLSPGGPVVTHCDGGGRAALAALAAVRAGYADVATYYLSFADWAADETCPVLR